MRPKRLSCALRFFTRPLSVLQNVCDDSVGRARRVMLRPAGETVPKDRARDVAHITGVENSRPRKADKAFATQQSERPRGLAQ